LNQALKPTIVGCKM